MGRLVVFDDDPSDLRLDAAFIESGRILLPDVSSAELVEVLVDGDVAVIDLRWEGAGGVVASGIKLISHLNASDQCCLILALTSSWNRPPKDGWWDDEEYLSSRIHGYASRAFFRELDRQALMGLLDGFDKCILASSLSDFVSGTLAAPESVHAILTEGIPRKTSRRIHQQNRTQYAALDPVQLASWILTQFIPRPGQLITLDYVAAQIGLTPEEEDMLSELLTECVYRGPFWQFYDRRRYWRLQAIETLTEVTGQVWPPRADDLRALTTRDAAQEEEMEARQDPAGPAVVFDRREGRFRPRQDSDRTVEWQSSTSRLFLEYAVTDSVEEVINRDE